MAYQDNPTKTLEDYSSEDNKELSKRHAFLLLGFPGVGKTIALRTIPSEDKALLLDFDNKGECLKKEIDSGQILRIDLAYSTKTFKEMYAKLKDILISLRNRPGEFQWVQPDSLTNLYALLDQIGLSKFPAQQNVWDKFAWIDKEFWDIIYTCVGAARNTILSCHMDYKGDETGVGAQVLPVARKAISQVLAAKFKESYHAVTYGEGDDIKYGWETKPTGPFGCNSLIPDVPFQVPNHYDLLISTNWSSLKGVKDPVKEAISKYEARTKRKVTNW